MANQKLSQLTAATTISDNDLFYLSASLSDKSIRYTVLKQAIESYINNWTDATFEDNDEDQISLGLAASYRGFQVEFIGERGTRCIKGSIDVVHDGTDVGYDYSITNIDRDNAGFSIVSAEIDSGAVVLNIEMDSSDSNDMNFKYRVLQIPVV